MRLSIQGNRDFDSLVGMPPDPDRLVALKNHPVPVVLRNLKNRIIRIGPLGVLRLEGSSLLKIVLLEDELAFDLSLIHI